VLPDINSVTASDAIFSIIEQVNQIPDSEKKIEFLIISNGGDSITALSIILSCFQNFINI
jgi:hypothetical protein